jgi:hypothetical protein
MLEKMAKSYPGLPIRETTRRCGAFSIRTALDNGKRKLSEDYSFCQRWRDIGGKSGSIPNQDGPYRRQDVHAGSLGYWLKERSAHENAA